MSTASIRSGLRKAAARIAYVVKRNPVIDGAVVTAAATLWSEAAAGHLTAGAVYAATQVVMGAVVRSFVSPAYIVRR